MDALNHFFRTGLIRLLAVVIVLAVGGLLSPVAAQNSTQKQRVNPNPLSQKVGTAVQWSPDWKTAQQQSRKTGQPIFWYVSTVPGTFMDRKPVIDRYMLGGPFSWPPLIELLNRHFVPLREVPGNDADKLGIRPYDFVEPGFLILSPDGEVLLKLDQLTTFHYGWLEELLVGQIKKWNPDVTAPATPVYFREFAGASRDWVDPVGERFEKNATNLLLSGMIAFRRGDHELARERWEEAARVEPDHPLAWKASLEAQGIGPFCRGFETFRALPDQARRAGVQSRGSAAPPSTYTREQVIERSVEFLLGMQREDGGFVDSDYDFGGTDSLPNVHVAVTSLAGMALLKVAASQPANQTAIEDAIVKAAEYVTNEENLNLADRDEILWAEAYRLRFLSRLGRIESLKQRVPEFRARHQAAIRGLETIQLKTGNWYHEYNNPWVTATALCALHEAEAAGGEVDDQKIKRGIESLLRDRLDNGAYPYYSARRPTERTARQQEQMLLASAGRMPLCELALVVWKVKNQPELVAAIGNSLEHHRLLASAYKYDNHTSNMAYGGFFFWYDMRSRSEAIRAVDDAGQRGAFQRQQQSLIDQLPEIDGCFVDSHELGRCYGTAMALLSMD